MKAPLPQNGAARLEALRQFEILDTDPEETFDDLARLAAYICETPIAVISLVDSDRQWFKSHVGLSADETSRDISFCAHAITLSGPFIVRDALDDERFRTNPLVTSDPHIRFYAGSPFSTVEGFKLGTLCVIDRVPRELRPDQVAALRMLSNQVMTQLELRRNQSMLKLSLETAKKKIKELEGQLNQK